MQYPMATEGKLRQGSYMLICNAIWMVCMHACACTIVLKIQMRVTCTHKLLGLQCESELCTFSLFFSLPTSLSLSRSLSLMVLPELWLTRHWAITSGTEWEREGGNERGRQGEERSMVESPKKEKENKKEQGAIIGKVLRAKAEINFKREMSNVMPSFLYRNSVIISCGLI